MKHSEFVLALFDLDNTLLAGDSDYEWAQFLIDRGVLDRDTHEQKNRLFYEQYQAGTLDIFEFLAFQLAPLAGQPRARLDEWHAAFMRERIEPLINPAAAALVKLHRDAGHTCAIVTATNEFVTAPIARVFGVEHLIATELEQRDGTFSGKPAGTPAFREGKVVRLEQWLASRGGWQAVADSWFYSDSANDLPLLERVHHPIAVDPDERLRGVASTRGWPILALQTKAGAAGGGA
jgi:HAD superfamily hydrolase (TIGR01490 family)